LSGAQRLEEAFEALVHLGHLAGLSVPIAKNIEGEVKKNKKRRLANEDRVASLCETPSMAGGLIAATNPLEEFVQSGRLSYQQGCHMKLSEFREVAKQFAGTRPINLSLNSLKDVLQPKGVIFLQSKKIDKRTAKASITWWIVGLHLVTDGAPC